MRRASLLVLIGLLLLGRIGGTQPMLELQFDPATGNWDRLSYRGKSLGPALQAPAIEIVCDEEAFPRLESTRLVSLDECARGLRVVQQAGKWRLESLFVVEGALLKRRLNFTWQGDEPVVVRRVILRTPPLKLSDSPEDFYLLPGNFPIERRFFSDLEPGRSMREHGWTHGEYDTAYVYSPLEKLGVVAEYEFEKDLAPVVVEETAAGVQLRHDFQVLAKVAPGRMLTTGEQWLKVIEGSEATVKKALSALAAKRKLGPPEDSPAGFKQGALYEFHPWGRLEIWPRGDKGLRFPRLTKLVPYYKRLGVKTCWLLSISGAPPWVYELDDFHKVTPEAGTPAELKRLIQAAHSADQLILNDLVVYGLRPGRPDAEALPPDVWCYTEDGKPWLIWGNSKIAADCSNPVWQERIGEVCRWWAQEFDFDGSRVDCIGWGQVPNWRNPDRANLATAYGGLQLNDVVRRAFREHNPEAVILPEGGQPLVFRHADMAFDYALYEAMRAITRTPDTGEWVQQVKEWLEFERFNYPERALSGLVRFTQNHDTVEPSDFFGVGLSQALMALTTFSQGVPLIYQEQETGYSTKLASWLELRNSHPAFLEGSADYACIESDQDEVLSFCRIAPSEAAVVAINCSDEACKVSLKWPKDLAGRFPQVVEGFSGKLVSSHSRRATLELAPYQVSVLLLEPADCQAAPSATISAEPETKKSKTQRPAYRELAPGRFEIPRATRWLVKTAEGTLEGTFNDFAAAVAPPAEPFDVLPVLQRAWNPLPLGRLDGAAEARLGLETPSGWVMGSTQTDGLQQFRLVNPKVDGRNVVVKVKPASAAKVYLAPGPDLSPLKRLQFEGIHYSPLKVDLKCPNFTLELARRRGGAPFALLPEGEATSLIGSSQVYTDQGIFPQRKLASSFYEYQPRLEITEGRVTFTGRLHFAPWNGVQSPPLCQAEMHYRLTYERTEDGLELTIGFTPGVDLPEREVFWALQMQVAGFEGWRSGEASGKAGEKLNVRLGETRSSGADWFEIFAGGHTLKLTHLQDFQNVFLLEDGEGGTYLFLAPFDMKPYDFRAGCETTAKVRVEVE